MDTIQQTKQGLDTFLIEIENLFSISDSLNNSFMTTKAFRGDSDFTEPTVDILSVKKFFDEVNQMKNDQLNKKIITSIGKLASTLVNDNKFNKPIHVRQLEILLETPYMLDPTYHSTLLDITKSILKLPKELDKILKKSFMNYDKERFRRLISLFHQFITIQLYAMGYIDEKIEYSTRILGFLSSVNEMRSKQERVSYHEFYNDAVNSIVDLKHDYVRWVKSKREKLKGFQNFSFCSYPFILDANSKSKVLEVDAQFQQSEKLKESLSLFDFRGIESLFFILKVKRDNLVETTLNGIASHPYDLKKQLRVKFIGEEGVDEGGPKKEFFQLIVKELLDVKYGMFTYREQTRDFWFNPNSLESSNTFRLIGNIIGLSIYNSVILDIQFPILIYKKLLGHIPTLEDLKEFDPDLGKGLQLLLDFEGDVENTFLRNFQIETEVYGEQILINLKPNGDKIPVTKENRKEYVDLYVKWLLVDSISKQFNAFKSGFDQVCSGPVLEIFKYEELELMVVGSSNLDFDALERVTLYAEGYKKDDQYIKDFWSIVKSFSEEDKKKFLQFSTGSDRAPIKGLGSMEFIIMKHGTTDQLPTSHTCFNHLLLPKYESKDKLKQKLLLAINNSQGFGLM